MYVRCQNCNWISPSTYSELKLKRVKVRIPEKYLSSLLVPKIKAKKKVPLRKGDHHVSVPFLLNQARRPVAGARLVS